MRSSVRRLMALCALLPCISDGCLPEKADCPQGHESRIWFDDVVLARKHIGPLKTK